MTERDFLAWLQRIRPSMFAGLRKTCIDPERQAWYSTSTAVMADREFVFRLTIDGIRWDVSGDWWNRYPVTVSPWDHTPHRLIRWPNLANPLGLTALLTAAVQDELF